MAKYEVTLKKTEIFVVTVEADTVEEATEQAWEKVNVDKTRYKHHNYSESSDSVYELD
jgi:hypothetical protein